MPATVTVQAMYQLLARSRLLGAEAARDALKKWASEAKDVDDPEKFRRFLIAQGLATEYQASLLAHGRTEGYFIGDCKILDRIGQGRMAGVYRAQTAAGEVVAVKVLPPSKAKNALLLARFQRETRLAVQMQHPHVVRTLAVGEADGLNFLVMELLEGETLEDVLQRRKRLPVNEAVFVARQALLGLQHIHDQAVVHRDLKPANLMLVPGIVPGRPDTVLSSTTKILDIGLGRETFDESMETLPAEQITSEGVLLGTPDYLAPEQARDARMVDIRADIYSLGCVLYHTLSGQPPFPDKSILNQMIRHAKEEPRPLREFNPEVPDGLQQVVKFMMAKDPGQRYPIPERAAKALQMFMAVPVSDATQPTARKGAKVPAGGGAVVAKPATAEKEPPKPAEKEKKKADEREQDSRKPAVPAPAAVGEYDVELVAIPMPPPAPIKPRLPRDQRPLYDLDRRDFIMLGTGMAGTLIAIVGAVGLARALRKKPDEKQGE